MTLNSADCQTTSPEICNNRHLELITEKRGTDSVIFLGDVYFVVETTGSFMKQTSLHAMKIASTQVSIRFMFTPFEPSYGVLFSWLESCIVIGQGWRIVHSFLRKTRFLEDSNILKGPSQPHLCFCLHARIWLLYFIRSLSKRRRSL